MGRIIEGFWDCKYCNTKGIRGSVKDCPNCGKPRDSTTKFYLNPNKMNYIPEEKAKNINKNPDWVCMFCDNLNPDDVDECVSCGAPRTKQNKTYFDYPLDETKNNQNKKTENNSFVNSSIQDTPTKESNEKLSKTSNTLKNLIKPSIVKPLLIALAIILLISSIVFLFVPKEQELLVQELSWDYSINIERFKTVTENDIYLPTGARLLYMTEEIGHYEDVLDHYETKTKQVPKERLVGYEEYVTGYKDLGNGYFEEITSSRPVYETYYETETYEEPVYRKEPVYRTRYFYEIDKWVYERSVNTSGNTKETYWGETNLKHDERVSTKFENYYVSGFDRKKEKTQKYSISFEDWNSLNVDKSYKFKVSLGFAELVD